MLSLSSASKDFNKPAWTTLMLMVFLTPLAFAPGLSFYYDVTPKVVVLLTGAAVLCLFKRRSRGSAWGASVSPVSETSPYARWNGWLIAAFVVSTLASAAVSQYGSMAWAGSNWRRFGAVEQLATLVAAYAASRVFGTPGRLGTLLRVLSLAGIVASGYAIAQYFRLDPFLPVSAYRFGDGPYQIVRPPGPMGHGNYLAAFLLWPIFSGLTLFYQRSVFRQNHDRRDRALGGVSACLGIIALVLSGSRGAVLGLMLGAGLMLWILRPNFRRVVIAAGIFALCAAAFYLSPTGAQLRARVFWIGEDSAGGSRLLLWRDTLRMALTRPWTGFGPDTFVAEFPRFTSVELARSYPDFYHESPHNMFLDTLTSQGFPGLVLLILLVALAFVAGRKALLGENRIWAAGLLAGLVATIAAHQFAVFVPANAFFFWVALGLITGLATSPQPTYGYSTPKWLRWSMTVSWVVAGAIFGVCAYQLAVADLRLARTRRLLESGNPIAAATAWSETQSDRSARLFPGVTADLYFSGRWSQASIAAKDISSKVQFSQLAANAAFQAASVPEQQANALYSLAMLQAAAGDAHAVENSLRAAIRVAPMWYKPHWSLARLLRLNDGVVAAQGGQAQREEAKREAQLSLDLNRHPDPELSATVDEILRSARGSH